IVHNAVGAKHGIMVFVESPNEPRFHTFAMMPVDAKEGKIFPEDIWTVEMEVEQALFGGLLAMIMEEEFAALDEYFEEFTNNHPVVGLRKEAINNVKKTGYTTPYYFLQPSLLQEELILINSLYLQNADITKEELRNHFDKLAYEEDKLSFVINLYMKEPDVEPDEEIIQLLVDDIINLEEFPRGKYTFFLHDHDISKLSGMGSKENSLREGQLEHIIKD
ncbi:DUF1672 family protein, partial [Metabacillus lacus]|uniref:DUF1672 family protein n=1 Tax=Metabacillus lacus TaxID=1983721 RepID=UPI0012B04C98